MVALQDELRINSIARWFINLVAAKITVEFVFVIVIAAKFEAFAIGCQFLFSFNITNCAVLHDWPGRRM